MRCGEIENIKGKTIEKAIHDYAYLCLFFTDGTHIIFRAGEEHQDSDSPDIIIMKDESCIKDYDLRNLGIISEDEYKKRDAEKKEEDRKIWEAHEREQLAILLERYGK